MAYEDFPWDDVGIANNIEVDEIAETIKHSYPGYTATRARTTRMKKRFVVEWVAMSSAEWLELVTFWRSMHGGADAFYWEFPAALYGAGSFGGVDGAEPDDGFDAEGGVGYGTGPTFLVQFEDDEMPQKHQSRFPGKWHAQIKFLEVA